VFARIGGRKDEDMKEGTTKRRDMIKNVAIVFLTVLLLLTFFSNTIMNYSLPEVATAYVQPNNITSRIRGSATVEASDPYNVVAQESRRIRSVAVKVGDFAYSKQNQKKKRRNPVKLKGLRL